MTKKKAVLLSDQDYIFDSFELWKKWEVFSDTINISKKYLLFKREFSQEEQEELDPSCKRAYHIIFVNVLQTASLLECHYSLFEKTLGSHFDPLEEAFHVANLDSLLWKRFFFELPYEHQEAGLLLGYGWDNTLFFKWKHQRNGKHSVEVSSFLDQLETFSREDTMHSLSAPHPFSIINFPLPRFVTFSRFDKTTKKYQEERQLIMDFYKGKGFVEATLDVLTGDRSY